MPTWIIAITVIVVLQTTSAYLGRLVPIAAPEFMREFGWDESWVGYLSAANVIGALFILTAGIGIIKRMGGVLALQLGLVIGAASLLLYLVPSLAVALIASMIIGLNNGAANPAGSEVLQRFTPPAHRNFVFSIKQAGVPLGGVVAGLTIPPLVNSLGWRMALVVAAVGSIAAVALMLPFRVADRSAARAKDAAPGSSASGCPTSCCRCARCRARRPCGGFPGSAACWRSRRPAG